MRTNALLMFSRLFIRVHFAGLVVLALVLCCGVVSAQPQNTASAKLSQADSGASRSVPNLVKFGGTAKDPEGKPLSGVLGITFALYQDEHTGAALWMETQNAEADGAGRYSVSLGANKPLPVELFKSGDARWLGVQVAGQKEGNRILLVSVPYAMKAADAETLGGLPPSAYQLAPLTQIAANGQGESGTASPQTPQATVTGTGTTNFLPIWTNSTTLGNSALFQTGGQVGIGNTAPSATLDVTGGGIFRGPLLSPASGKATAAKGFPSNPHDFAASAFNKKALDQTFRFQAEPVGNNTKTPSATLNLLFGAGVANPSETGLSISSKGLIAFASGQTFPGAGTITGVTTAATSGLSGGGTTGNLSLTLLTTCANKQILQWNGSKWLCATIAGGGGGGTVTSVALKAPAEFTVSGSPVTTSGTLTFNWKIAPSSANAANAIVTRNAAGNFEATDILANSLNATGVTAHDIAVVDLAASDIVNVNSTNFNAVVGQSSSTNAVAISALATSTTGPARGMEGQTNSNHPAAAGVVGVANASRGTTQGVNGVSLSSQGIGLLGQGGSGSYSGVLTSQLGNYPIGAVGDVTADVGAGVLATADQANALVAENNSDGFPTLAAKAIGESPVIAAYGPTGHVYILGTGVVDANGYISHSASQSRIDHPLDPTQKYLNHAAIESSETLNLYSGNAVLGADGSAAIQLPDWFTAMNSDFRYQLTPIGGFAQIYIAEEIGNNQFVIAGGRPGMKVSWQVTGIRVDAYTKMHPLVVESSKEGAERGLYIHPEAFGASSEMGVNALDRGKLPSRGSAKATTANTHD